jgi:hypothetical protein
VRLPRFLFALLLLAAAAAQAGPAKVIKVLPHFLDSKGRDSVSPSLFERDAYQMKLRENATNRSALRFDVQWRAAGMENLVLRVEARGMAGRVPQTRVVEEKVAAGRFSTWTALTIGGEDYKKFGELISWRATLWSGTNRVAEQDSFLW